MKAKRTSFQYLFNLLPSFREKIRVLCINYFAVIMYVTFVTIFVVPQVSALTTDTARLDTFSYRNTSNFRMVDSLKARVYGNFARGNSHLYILTYPNPVREQLKVELQGLYSIQKGSGYMAIRDILGREVLNVTGQYLSSSNGTSAIFSIDIRSIRSGMYMLVFQSGVWLISSVFIIYK